MTNAELIKGLQLIEDNLTEFDELTDNGRDYTDVHVVLYEAIEALKHQKQGEWIPVGAYACECSQCSGVIIGNDATFCPKCGARMQK